MNLENKNVLIFGFGNSGQSAFNFLTNKKANVFCYDDASINTVTQNYVVKDLTKDFLKKIDLIVINPAVSIFHKQLCKARELKIPIISEIQLGEIFIKNKVIAVTGTDGKSTTVSLINEILNTFSENNSLLAGNIGKPLTSVVENANNCEHTVLEVSSFMLEAMPFFKPHISAITNITPDHLNRHKNFKNYIKIKFNIFKNQNFKDFAVLNFDDKNVMKNAKRVHAQLFYFSLDKKVKGAYIKNQTIFFNNGAMSFEVMPVCDVKLIGEHNLQNVLCAICVCCLCGVGAESIRVAVRNFKSLPHRIEYVAEKNGIKFFNDSKSTTIKSCLCAINCFKENIVLIMGGSSKNQNYDEFAKFLTENIKFIVLIGEEKEKIANALNKVKFKNYSFEETLSSAVKKAIKESSFGGVVLLSPSTASFDMFKNFEERGNLFKSEVQKFLDEN